MEKIRKVSVIIAARNEETRIGGVLEAVYDHPLVDEVIVFCNDCTDNTAKVARSYGVTVIEEQKALGKTMAVRRSLDIVKNDIVLLVDADLQNMTKENITNLAKPVLEDMVDFTVSLRGNSLLIYKLFGIDFCSGERAIKKELLLEPTIWSKPHLSYGLEVLMNNSLLKAKKKFVVVKLNNVRHPMKSEKVNFFRGLFEDLAMVFNISKALPFYKVVIQFFKMAYLNKKYRKEIRKHEKEEVLV